MYKPGCSHMFWLCFTHNYFIWSHTHTKIPARESQVSEWWLLFQSFCTYKVLWRLPVSDNVGGTSWFVFCPGTVLTCSTVCLGIIRLWHWSRHHTVNRPYQLCLVFTAVWQWPQDGCSRTIHWRFPSLVSVFLAASDATFGSVYAVVDFACCILLFFLFEETGERGGRWGWGVGVGGGRRPGCGNM